MTLWAITKLLYLSLVMSLWECKTLPTQLGAFHFNHLMFWVKHWIWEQTVKYVSCNLMLMWFNANFSHHPLWCHSWFNCFFLLLLAQPSCDCSPCYPSHSVSEHIHLTCKCQLGAVPSGTGLDNELCPRPPRDTLTPFLFFLSGAAALLAPLFCGFSWLWCNTGNRIFSKVEH